MSSCCKGTCWRPCVGLHCALVGVQTEVTVQPVRRRCMGSLGTQSEGHHGMGERQTTDGIGTACCRKIHPESVWCCVKPGFPASQGVKDLLTTCFYSVILKQLFHYITCCWVFPTEIWKEPCTVSPSQPSQCRTGSRCPRTRGAQPGQEGQLTCHCWRQACSMKLIFKTHKWERDADSQPLLAPLSVIFHFKTLF